MDLRKIPVLLVLALLAHPAWAQNADVSAAYDPMCDIVFAMTVVSQPEVPGVVGAVADVNANGVAPVLNADLAPVEHHFGIVIKEPRSLAEVRLSTAKVFAVPVNGTLAAGGVGVIRCPPAASGDG